MNRIARHPLLRFGLASVLAASLSACGKESFETISTLSVAEAPGYFTLAPKVDILLAQDNTGSMKEVYSSIGTEVPKFLSNLENTGWDYHFAAIPLTGNASTRLFSQIVASKHDRNWGESEWRVPYPGALFSQNEPGTIVSSFFRRPSQYTDYRYRLAPTATNSGQEAGLFTLTSQLKNQFSDTGFHRDDALLVVIVLGNGDDTSGRMICERTQNNTSYQAPCDYPTMERATIISCGSPSLQANGCVVGRTLDQYPSGFAAQSLVDLRDHFRGELEALRPSASQVQLHAAVATGGNCYGAGSYSGFQYSRLAQDMGGTAQNFCVSQTSSMLNTIQQSLEVQRMSLLTVLLMLDHEPNISTIEVVRYPNGDRSQAVTIPQDAENGWSFAGYIEDQPRVVTADDVAMNRATGWAVRLNGSARLSGSDTAEVFYKPGSSQN